MEIEPCPTCRSVVAAEYDEDGTPDFVPAPLWLSGAIYRVLADPEVDEVKHRNLLYATFNDQPPELIDQVVNALIEYGSVRETGATERAHGDLSIEPYEEHS